MISDQPGNLTGSILDTDNDDPHGLTTTTITENTTTAATTTTGSSGDDITGIPTTTGRANLGFTPPEDDYLREAWNELKKRDGLRLCSEVGSTRTGRFKTAIHDDSYVGFNWSANVILNRDGHRLFAAEAPNSADQAHMMYHTLLNRLTSKVPGALYTTRPDPSVRKSAIIVQLADDTEMRTRYLPEGNAATDKSNCFKCFTNRSAGNIPSIHVRALSVTEEKALNCRVTKLRVKYVKEPFDPNNSTDEPSEELNDSSMDVLHYYYKNWPDMTAPKDEMVETLKNLISTIYMQIEQRGGPHNCDTMVHCKAGVGRTGVWQQMYFFLSPPPSIHQSHIKDLPTDEIGEPSERLRNDKLFASCDLHRACRPSSVYTKSQFTFLYKIFKDELQIDMGSGRTGNTVLES